MKRLLYILVSIVFLTLGTSCKTKDVIVDKGTVNEYQVVEVESLKSYLNRHSTTHVENQLTQEELVQALSQLNINYNGDHTEDKLDVLLSKTKEGTKLSIQGKGTAGYTENISSEISTLRNEMFQYTDSLVNQIIIAQQRNFKQSEAEWNKRLKEVKSKTFTPVVWLIIGLAVVVGMCLNWISKHFKTRLKVD